MVVADGLACLLILMVLLAPNEFSQLTPGALVSIPLEALLGAAVLLILPRRARPAAATLFGLALGVVLVTGLSQITLGTVVGLDDANSGAGGNVQAIADILFSRYVFAFETTSALLITAAVGAMVLAHRERLVPKPSQADLAAKRCLLCSRWDSRGTMRSRWASTIAPSAAVMSRALVTSNGKT